MQREGRLRQLCAALGTEPVASRRGSTAFATEPGAPWRRFRQPFAPVPPHHGCPDAEAQRSDAADQPDCEFSLARPWIIERPGLELRGRELRCVRTLGLEYLDRSSRIRLRVADLHLQSLSRLEGSQLRRSV